MSTTPPDTPTPAPYTGSAVVAFAREIGGALRRYILKHALPSTTTPPPSSQQPPSPVPLTPKPQRSFIRTAVFFIAIIAAVPTTYRILRGKLSTPFGGDTNPNTIVYHPVAIHGSIYLLERVNVRTYPLNNRMAFLPNTGIYSEYAELSRPLLLPSLHTFPIAVLALDADNKVVEVKIINPGDPPFQFTQFSRAMIWLSPTDLLEPITPGTTVTPIQIQHLNVAAIIAAINTRTVNPSAQPFLQLQYNATSLSQTQPASATPHNP